MTEDFVIRPAQPDDIPALNDLLLRAFDMLLRPDYPAEVLEYAVPIMGRARPELVASGTYFIAVDADDCIIGAGGWTIEPPNGGKLDARVGNVRHFAVEPTAARRGIATAIMAHVAQDAAAQGVAVLDCLSTRSAVGFYRSAGFEVLGETAAMLAKNLPFPAVRMERHLARR